MEFVQRKDLNQEDQHDQEEEEEDHHMITSTKFSPSISQKYNKAMFVHPPPPPRPPPQRQEAINFMDLSLDHHQQQADNQASNCWPPDYEREHMFDKVVTPSDVGKLNRLVIPKQHAEKYFPLDSSSTEKGLLLNFVDRTGKPWRFRYSYWNSSQSYVMTKGWSRFVKEKRLDAGDIVSFERGVGELGRQHFYIDWRRRPPPPPPPSAPHHYHFGQFGTNCYNDGRWGGGGVGGGGRLYSVLQRPMSMPVRMSHEHFHHPYHHHQHHQMMNPQYNLNHYHHQHHVVRDQYPIVIDSVPFVDHQHGKTSMTMMSSSSTSGGSSTGGGKRLRLFGVNMNVNQGREEEEEEEEEEDFHQTVGVHDHLDHQCQILPSTAIPFQHHHHHLHHNHIVPTAGELRQLPNTMTSTTPAADHYLYSNFKGKSFYLDP